LLLITLFCLIVPIIDPEGVIRQNPILRLKPPSLKSYDSGQVFLFGSDALGRDLIFRVAEGGRYSLAIGILTALLAAAVGTLTGLPAGYFGRNVERIVMAIVDLQLALPEILVALLLIAVLGPGIGNLIIAMVASGWAQYARMVRGRVLSIREEQFIEAARSIGSPPWRIMRKNILPQTFNTILVLLTQQIGFYILLESSLSYLGLGVQVPTPSWGNVISGGRLYLSVAWWITTLPGMMLTLAVSSAFLLGDGLRDLLDPRLAKTK
jgi:peptide/nickel transport system permease protein